METRWLQVTASPVGKADLIVLKYIFGANAFISLFSTHKLQTHINSIVHNSIAKTSCKTFLSWRESNPGLLFLRRMRCRLRRTAPEQLI
jgi:hypothetical protein